MCQIGKIHSYSSLPARTPDLKTGLKTSNIHPSRVKPVSEASFRERWVRFYLEPPSPLLSDSAETRFAVEIYKLGNMKRFPPGWRKKRIKY